MKLLDKIKNKRLKVGIIGLGYVGLPLAIEFAKSGIETIGIDINGQKVSMLNAGKSYIQDIDSQLIKHLVEKSKFTATNDFKAIASIDVVFVCVPTPFNKAKAPDISFMINAAKSISSYLSKEKLIVLQSTTYPGTTDEDIIPILEQSGLKAGKDFYIAFSPERIDPGNKKFNVKNTPKIVGGLTLKCADLTKRVFSLIIDEKNIHVVSCPRSAEMCKLLENIFRSVNIALVNELLILSNRMGIDFWEVIDAAATKPFGFLPFYPGPGVGGHCIPVDPYYLSWKAREYNFFANFIELAAEVNQNMPYYAVEKIGEALNLQNKSLKNATVFILGLTFKKNIDDIRNSPSFEIIKLLLNKGAKVWGFDPYVNHYEAAAKEYDLKGDIHFIPLTKANLKKADAVAILVNHDKFNLKMIADNSKVLIDMINAAKYLNKYKNIIKL
ncbi:UDP-N-acetyl-D-glucosamine dehydrogenase [candidate division WOR-1 bacterium RIFOXYC2_FULL_37_10]|uniref:UDP-N-acetyl-D-glucosamine dehydrogenase n=1 Tax=candidate division WOR-1 bacterium RIFOXYB2_FULL_37_13 TaxID=1802579 RepID=A0A1F4SQA1_UNCSA|nr:MAG: UDP-N-acetyl-D-glucosamine dehydrogenase [candidate division WOR-1 bacterium RIFOXYB2_FULL_37_13]OGC33348.1 MAG: UDP-N-acetyl-D-glucosamine dehydrogenase [candidate division WOR-1 bacterium RIFOXYC2_FULL_37_10]